MIKAVLLVCVLFAVKSNAQPLGIFNLLSADPLSINKPVEYKYDFQHLQAQIKKSVDDALSQIHEQIKSNEYTLPNFNLTNYNFLDTTKFLTQSLENVEKSFEYAVDTIVDVVSVVNGTKIGLPQIDVRKEEAINKINSLANSVLSNIDDIKETVENLKQKKIK